VKNKETLIDIIFEQERTYNMSPDDIEDQERFLVWSKEFAISTKGDIDRFFTINEVGNICDLKSGDEISSCNYEFDY